MKYILRLCVFCTCCFSAVELFASDEIHRFATYNIRYVAEKNGDTGLKSWTSRRSYLMRLIRDYDFDMCGLNEVTGNNVDSVTGVSQLQDLKDTLTEYTFIPYERSGTGDYSYNVVIYKKSKYECLDHGCFWLSATPDKSSKGWGDDMLRTFVWTKMKVISTGEIFFFCSTHVSGSVARQSAEVIADRINKIAGNYPLIFGGDFNSYTNIVYEANFQDAAKTAEKSESIPIEGITYTYTAWSKTGSQLPIDLIFYRNMKVYNRYIITEEYGRGLGPSDHYPVLVTCSLRSDTTLSVLYVDNSVSTSGDGTKNKPYATISEAFQHATFSDTIRVTEGIYKEALTMPASLVLKGGYNTDFTAVVGKTVLNGDVNDDDISGAYSDNLSQLLNAGSYWLAISHFTFKNAYAATANGAGIYHTGPKLILRNVDFLNNYSALSGSGLYTSGGTVSIDSCVFDDNKSGVAGGGAFVSSYADTKVTHTLFQNNVAVSGSALMLYACVHSYFQSNSFVENKSEQFGTLCLQASAVAESHHLLNNTFANNVLNGKSGLSTLVKQYGGAAICAHLNKSACTLNLAHNTMVGNQCDYVSANQPAVYTAAALNISNATLILQNNFMAGNYSLSGMGDLNLDTTVVISKNVGNLFTDTTSANVPLSTNIYADSYTAGITALGNVLDGTVSDNIFTANVADNGGYTPTVKIKNTDYDGHAVNCLTAYQRYITSDGVLDLDGTGKTSGYLKIDQRGIARLTKACIGAYEYIPETNLNSTYTETLNVISLGNGKYKLPALADGTLVKVYDTLGRNIAAFANSVIDISGYASGVYLLVADGKSVKIIN